MSSAVDIEPREILFMNLLSYKCRVISIWIEFNQNSINYNKSITMHNNWNLTYIGKTNKLMVFIDIKLQSTFKNNLS